MSGDQSNLREIHEAGDGVTHAREERVLGMRSARMNNRPHAGRGGPSLVTASAIRQIEAKALRR